MAKRIKILFVSQHVISSSTYQAGHQSFNYYLSKFHNDDAFEVGYIVEHNGGEEFIEMKNQFYKAHDFSIRTYRAPIYLRAFKYIYYNTSIKYLFSIINPQWIYLDPFRKFLYKKALLKISQEQWIPEILVFEWTEVIFLRDFCSKLFTNSLFVATEHDVSFNKLFRQFNKNIFFKIFLLNRFKNKEISTLKKFDLIIVLSEDDLLLLEANSVNRQKILLISPYYMRTNQKQISIRPEIIFYGAMNRAENLKAVKWFLDKVYVPYKLYNLISFIVIGSGVPKKFKTNYKNVKKFSFTGFVKSPSDYFKTALCMVVPLTYGGGIKVKVLEAMSSSVAVLSNDIGIEGIKAIANVSYLHCTYPSDYYNEILKLFKDNELAQTIGEAARLMIESNYDYEESYYEYKNRLINMLKNM